MTLCHIKTCVLIVLHILALFGSVSATTYYVVPTLSTPCPEPRNDHDSCLTLSHHARNSSNFDSNTTLILLPGNHSLEMEFFVQNIPSLTIISAGNISDSDTVIINCSQSASFRLVNITVVSMRGLELIGCVNNIIASVEQFTVEDCNLQGKSQDGSGLGLYNVMCAYIVSSSFSFFTSKEALFDYGSIGGALLAMSYSGDCSIVLNSTSFFDNTAASAYSTARGGAVQATNCNITLKNDCSFINNRAVGKDRAYGGAIWAYNWADWSVDCVINIDNSEFINNTASGGEYSVGGAIIVCYCRLLTITNSLFDSNLSVDGNILAYGGAMVAIILDESKMTIDNSTFIKNMATNTSFCAGGAVYITQGTESFSVIATISNSEFIDNTCRASNTVKEGINVTGAYGTFAYGGAFTFNFRDTTVIDIGSIMIHNSSFFRNTATSHDNAFSGAMLIYGNADREISGSKFFDNTANGNSALAGAILNFCPFDSSVCNKSIVAHDSVFHNNSAIGVDLSIGGAMLNIGSTDITISNCEFMKNSASSSSRSSEHGLGGVVSSFNGNLYLNNSRFTQNIAMGAFGGVLTLSNCSLTSYSLTILENTADTFVMMAINSTMYFSVDTAISNNNGLALQAFLCPTVIFSGNTNIENNNVPKISQEGGTVTVIYSTIDFNGSTNIMYNKAIRGGAISATQSTVSLSGSVTIAHNKADISGGGIYAIQSDLNFKNPYNISLIENDGNERGGGVHVVSSTLWAFDGSKTYFARNNAKRGGGVCLESNSKLYIFKDTLEVTSDTVGEAIYLNYLRTNPQKWIRLEFKENTANYGGAVYITDTNSETCSAKPFSGASTALNECFIQGLGTVDTFNLLNFDYLHALSTQSKLFEKQNVRNTYFLNNNASVAGNSIYGGLLDRCKINPTAGILFDGISFRPSISINATTYLINITNTALPEDDNKEISSDAVRVCFCRDNQPNCSYQPEPQPVSRGQAFNVSLVAVDQVNNTISIATIIHGFVDLPARLGEGESIQKTNENGACTNLTYRILSNKTKEQLFLYADGPCMSAGISLANTNVSIKRCPVGFVDTVMRCVCDPLLLDNGYIYSCSIDDGTVFRREGVWFDHYNNTGYILHKHCPFDYCVKSAVPVNLSSPDGSDSQCDFNRAGKLCGSCKENYSLSLGSSECISDSKCDNMLALLIVFALAGVALVAFILVCNLTVAVGTINGLIFYANILTTNRATFLPFSDTPIGIFFTVFIAWLNLDFGIVTCFYEGMNAYEKEWYQIIFPLYIILMVAIVITACEYSTRIARIFTKTHPVAALATLILLSYTKSLRVIIAAFSPATLTLKLNNSNSSTETVWLIDASISYFEWKRTPFLLVAVLILLVGIAYTLFLFCYQWLLRCSYNRALEWIRSARFYPFMDAYHAPYSKKYRYWTGLLLFVRAFLYIIAAANVGGDPSINLLSISITMAALCFLKVVLYSSVYKSWLLDILELSFIFNLLIFSVATFYNRETGGNQAALAYTSTSIAFIAFLIILLYHTYAFVLPKKLRNKLDSIKPKVPTDEDNDDTYDIKPAQENKCTYSVVDPIPPIPPLAELKALFKPRQKEDSSNEDEPNYARSSHAPNENPTHTNGQKIECRVEIELEEIQYDRNGTDSNNDQNSFSMAVNGVACERKSPTLSKKTPSNNEQNYSLAAKGVACENKSSVPFANPYITDEDQRGLERETEINEIIEITQ